MVSLGMAVRENYALIIGNSNYQHLPPLKNPRNDATDLTQALKSMNFHTFEYNDLSKQATEDVLVAFGKRLNRDSLALVYYAGHGMQLDNQNYLVPVDASLKSKAITKNACINVEVFVDELTYAGSSIRIIILDACRDIPTFSRALRHMGIRQGLAQLSDNLLSHGLLIAYAASANQKANDGLGRNSPYVQHLKKYIVNPSLDVEKIFQETRIAVIKETQSYPIAQHPVEYGGFSDYVYFSSQPNQEGQEDTTTSPAQGSYGSSATLPNVKIITPEQLVQQPIESSGKILKLAEGTFRIDQTLVLKGDVSLIGEGYQKTRIVSSAPDYVLRYQGGGTLTLQGISFEHTGDTAAHVMGADGGFLDIEACSFQGGFFDEKAYWGGNGLRVIKDTRGSIRESFFSDNDIHGIQMTDDVVLELAHNRFHANQGSGIVYFDNSAGSASYNASFGNEQHGVVIMNQAHPRLEHNKIYRNQRLGIYSNQRNYSQSRQTNTIENNAGGDFGLSD